MRALLLATFLLAAGSAYARKPQEFVPREISQEEIEAAKKARNNKMETYTGDSPVETKPFPWGPVGFIVLSLLVAMPFGLKMYKNTSEEISGRNAFGSRKRAASDE